MRAFPFVSRLTGGALLCVTLWACATNPATGKREIMLVSEDQEVSMGREADKQAVAAFGLLENRELQSYVDSIGQQIAKDSERPQLPWTFRVVDDAAVNAFALPGGFIYVTRGLLTHLNSEAELAMVMGHEVGHVTARHSASQVSKAQLATLGLGIGMIAVPELQRFGQLGQAGLSVLFLKFGRDDEREADDLGMRYSSGLGYDPRNAARAMEMLDLLARSTEGQGRMPGWLSTHPDPGDRYQRLLASLPQGRSGRRTDREQYLRRIDGLVFGEDPREGFFRDGVFYHPEMRFEMDVPQGFKTQNTKQAVIAASPQGDAVLQLTLAPGTSAQQAARQFASQGVQPVDMRATEINGLPAVAGNFQAVSGQAQIAGAAAFVEHGGRVFQLIGYTSASDWGRYGRALSRAVQSFGPLRDRSALEVQPRRLRVVPVQGEVTVEEFARRNPSSVPTATVALINHLSPGDTLKPGQLAKQVVGGRGLQTARAE